MCRANAETDNIGPGYNEVGNAETSVSYIDDDGTIKDDRPGEVEGKVNIVARENQTDVNSEIYYAMHLGKNKTPTTLDMTNKAFIMISS